MKQKLIMENWRKFLNESLQDRINTPPPTEAIEEGATGVVFAFLLGSPNQNGLVVTGDQMVTVYDALSNAAMEQADTDQMRAEMQLDNRDDLTAAFKDAVAATKGVSVEQAKNTLEKEGYNVQLVDLDGDGDLDLFIDKSGGIMTYLGTSRATLDDAGLPSYSSVAKQVKQGQSRISGTSTTTTFNYEAFAKMLKGQMNVSGDEAQERRVQHAQRIIKANDAGIGDPNDPEQKAAVDLAKKALAGT